MDEKLDIINAMLAIVGSNGVTSTIGRHPNLIKALPILARVTKTAQMRGHWFNTDWGLSLKPDTDGEFLVPQTTLKCDTTDKRSPYVRRGRRMYDPHNHTYVIEESEIKVDVVIELDYEFLPGTVTDLIRARAVMEMATNAEADQVTMKVLHDAKVQADMDFERERRSQADTSLRDNPEYAFIMGGLRRMYSGGRNAQRIGG